jgi:Zn-dependent protease
MEFVNFNENKIKIRRFGKNKKFSISNIEIYHLLLASVITSLTFLLLGSFYDFKLSEFLYKTIFVVPAFLLGFILHEFGHKFSAQHFGFLSEFRADLRTMLILLLVSPFISFIILSPGAVMVMGRANLKENGIISICGPLVNLGLIIISYLLLLIFPSTSFSIFLTYLIQINIILGIFNMLPFWVLDGKKVLAWSPLFYFLVLGIFLIFLFISFF